jgi:soluble lytic murein transglycosylase-like protein
VKPVLLWTLLQALTASGSAAAQDTIYRSVTAAGTAVYTNQAHAGATLLMALPPAHVRASYVQDETSGALRATPRASRTPAQPNDPSIASLIGQAARRHGIDIELLTAVIRQESGFDPRAVSGAGARGLMQLMPQTAKRYGATRVHDPGENIAAGSAYLRDLLDRFGRIDLALAAYNAGEGAVQKYGNSIPPFEETRHYVASVMADYRWRKQQPAP